MAVLRVLGIEGDESFEYEADVEDDRARRAKKVFDEKLKRGYLAFVPDDGPSKSGTQIRRFDPKAREIILQPQIVGG